MWSGMPMAHRGPSAASAPRSAANIGLAGLHRGSPRRSQRNLGAVACRWPSMGHRHAEHISISNVVPPTTLRAPRCWLREAGQGLGSQACATSTGASVSCLRCRARGGGPPRSNLDRTASWISAVQAEIRWPRAGEPSPCPASRSPGRRHARSVTTPNTPQDDITTITRASACPRRRQAQSTKDKAARSRNPSHTKGPRRRPMKALSAARSAAPASAHRRRA